MSKLQEGDVIAYRMSQREVRSAILKGHLSKVGYSALTYGHLAILVDMQEDQLLLLSSQSFKGPNTQESILTLKDHHWDAYRLDKPDCINKMRLHEFVVEAQKKAGKWYGNDFSGMFGLWNSNLKPDSPEKIGHDYICSTVVVAALYYSGIQLDAIQRHGFLDLVSPKQVVTSKGIIIPIPEVEIDIHTQPASP